MVALIAGAGWLVVRDVLQSRRRSDASAVVQELGGKMGSLGAWPFGDEIHVEFHRRNLSQQDLAKLSILKPLTGRNWVAVMFSDTNLTREDILELRESLPGCVIFRVVDGTRIPE
ncbi:MAG: hypothetical protein KF774_14685 [Planctomyces sp.]|nr:hypothetical protein [Planctomyces sp.]